MVFVIVLLWGLDFIYYREKNGAFRSIEDIKKVEGIKDGLFSKIKDKIKI